MERINYLIQEIGPRTAPDLLMFLMNKEFTQHKSQEAFRQNPTLFANTFSKLFDKMAEKPKES